MIDGFPRKVVRSPPFLYASLPILTRRHGY
jgi:hypothetical protein